MEGFSGGAKTPHPFLLRPADPGSNGDERHRGCCRDLYLPDTDRFVRGVLVYIIESVPLEQNRNMGIIVGNDMVDTSQKITIQGGDRSWKYSGKGSIDGKQPHMASAVEELEARREDDYQQHKSQNSASISTSPPDPIFPKDDTAARRRFSKHSSVSSIL